MIHHSKPTIQTEDIQAVKAVLAKGMIASGEMASRVERAFCERFQARFARAVGSASQGLLIAVKAAGVDKSDEVILPTYVCPEVLSVVEHVGAIPVLVDIEWDYIISAKAVESAVTSKTKAVILPYVMGIWRNLSSLFDHKIPIIEDCAQLLFDPAVSPSIKLIGDLAVFSFHATKLVAAGEGGMVITTNAHYEEVLRSQKSFRGTVYKHNLYPMTDLQAALLSTQMRRLPFFLKRRQEIAEGYFSALGHLRKIRLPQSFRKRSIFFRFPVRLIEGHPCSIDDIIENFHFRGIAIRRPVDVLLHRLCPDLNTRSFPVAEDLFATTLSVPIYPSLTENQFQSVVSATQEVLA